jgi:hypothetical protein
MIEHEIQNAAESEVQSARSLREFANAIEPRDASQTEPQLNEHIEDYLDQIYAPMVGRLPYARRQELRNEMRAHVAQLVAAHAELGSEREEAVSAALRQFGEPSLVAGRWLQQLPAERGFTARNLIDSTRTGAFGVAAKRLAIGVALWVAFGVIFDRNISGTVPVSLYISLGASLPFTIGYTMGRRYAASGPEFAMLAAQTAVIPFWPVFMMWLMNLINHMQPDIRTAAAMGAISLLSAAPLGCLGAWLGKWQTHRESRKRAIAG